MDIRPLFSGHQWPRVESRIRESMEEFMLRRLQPLEGNSAQYLDSPGSHTPSFAHEITIQQGPISRRTPPQRPANFNLEDKMLHRQNGGDGNKTIDSAYYSMFNRTNATSSQTGTGFPVDEPAAIDGCVDPETFYMLPDQGFQFADDIVGFPDNLANPSSAQGEPDLLDLGRVGYSQQRRNQC